MEIEADQNKEGNFRAADRARNMSQALADAARKVRLSRNKNLLTGGGFQARRGQRKMQIFVWGSFFALVVVPTLCALIYYSLIASDQYATEAQFTIMGGEVRLNDDNVGATTGIPLAAIIQDTYVVANYIHSRAMIEDLQRSIDLQKIYGSDHIDWFARLPTKAPIEKFLRYWKDMVSVSISMPSGIVKVEVRAFSPVDAAQIGKLIIESSEKLINELNARTNADMVANTEAELSRSVDRLKQARIALETARNDEGILDADRTAELFNKLITDARGSLIALQQERATQLKYAQESSPQMRILTSRIAAVRAQIADLEAKLTATNAPNNSRVISGSMSKFALLDLEKQIAERLYTGSVVALEVAKMAAERKAMYLNTFVWPIKPEYALYPKRFLWASVIIAGSLASWGLLVGLMVLARNHMPRN